LYRWRKAVYAPSVIDPSAGTGVFADSLRESAPDAEMTCFEKEPMDSMILKHLRPEDNVRVQGYEAIERSIPLLRYGGQ
jgi:hypothetical protein